MSDGDFPSGNLRSLSVVWGLVVLFSLVTVPVAFASDQAHTLYFEQLRQRGLFSLAEGEAISRLASDKLPLADKTQFSIELSRTLMEHAVFVSDEQREELWQRARSIILELIEQNPTNPRSQQLEGQLAAVAIAEATWMCEEHLVRPFDETLAEQARRVLLTAIEQLNSIEKALSQPSRDTASKKSQAGSPSSYELRSLLHHVRWQTGLAWFHLAELAAADADDRTANIANAEQSLGRLKDVADEPLQSRSKVLLAACARLKRNFNRAAELLAPLEKSEAQSDTIRSAVTVERAKLLLASGRPDEAAELLLKERSRRQRLTGEMWFLQTRALIALTEIAAEKKQETLTSGLNDQIKTTIERCQDQVGGFWARRCRQLWDNAQTTKKYGPELDGLMQLARNDFTAGRIESSLEKYAAAEKVAIRDGLSELAMELGFTRASILLDQKQNDSAAAEFFRLVSDYPDQQRAARAHLLGTYSLGRLYDEKKSQQRREAYTEALDRHLKDYAGDETVNDARFLKAQLEEQRLQATQALPLYLDIDPAHPRAPEAAAGAARCYETILKRMQERGLATDEMQREAIERLTRYLTARGGSIDQWTPVHADVALRLASILLMRSSGTEVSKDSNATAQTDVPSNGDESRFAMAQRWLDQVSSYLAQQETKEELKELVAGLRHRAEPLKLVTLAARGQFLQAEQSLNSLSKSDAVLFSVVEALDRIGLSSDPSGHVATARLQLKAAALLAEHKEQLSVAQRNQLDQMMINSYLATGEAAKAIEILKRMSDATTKDATRQREIAEQLAILKVPESLPLAKQCWRRVESLTKPGSPEWISARQKVLGICIQQNQVEEARKLFQVTKVLYPDLGGEAFRKQFEELETALRERK